MNNDDVMIRPFEATDTPRLSKIWLDASLLAHPFIGSRRLRDQRALIEEQYLPSAETWVATESDQPVGFISLLETFIGGLFISPNRQGLGIGRQLVSHALTLRGELSLEVYTQNSQAMAFYRALGFQELSRRLIDDEGYPFENARLRLARSAAADLAVIPGLGLACRKLSYVQALTCDGNWAGRRLAAFDNRERNLPFEQAAPSNPNVRLESRSHRLSWVKGIAGSLFSS